MSYLLCRHAVKKKDTISLEVCTNNDWPREYHTREWTKPLSMLELLFAEGEIRFSRKPTTKLEKQLAEASDKLHLLAELNLIKNGVGKEASGVISQAVNWIKEH